MKKELDIGYIILYCETFGGGEKNFFFFDTEEYKVYKRDELISKMGYNDDFLDDEYALRYDSPLIPVFRVNIIENIKYFLSAENNRRASEILSESGDMSADEIFIHFMKICERDAELSSHWSDFIGDIEIRSAVEWCRENNIICKNADRHESGFLTAHCISQPKAGALG